MKKVYPIILSLCFFISLGVAGSTRNFYFYAPSASYSTTSKTCPGTGGQSSSRGKCTSPYAYSVFMNVHSTHDDNPWTAIFLNGKTITLTGAFEDHDMPAVNIRPYYIGATPLNFELDNIGYSNHAPMLYVAYEDGSGDDPDFKVMFDLVYKLKQDLTIPAWCSRPKVTVKKGVHVCQMVTAPRTPSNNFDI